MDRKLTIAYVASRVAKSFETDLFQAVDVYFPPGSNERLPNGHAIIEDA
jgi:hypothetical protein